MRGTMLFLFSWLGLAGLVAFFATGSILALFAFGVVLYILNEIAGALE